jgi:hypothetical protein
MQGDTALRESFSDASSLETTLQHCPASNVVVVSPFPYINAPLQTATMASSSESSSTSTRILHLRVQIFHMFRTRAGTRKMLRIASSNGAITAS